jgi:hypothetical protein
MKNPSTSVRDRLIGKRLIGFDTRAGVARTPRAMVGTGGEIKPAS